jgi:hypothetical protein
MRISSLHERLVKGAGCLERLDWERSSGGNPILGKAIEERIVFRELLDLELQDCDEQIERLSEVAHNLFHDTGNWPGCGNTPRAGI